VAADSAGHSLVVTSLATLSEPVQRVDLSQRGILWPQAVVVRAQDARVVKLMVAEALGRVWELWLARDGAGRVDLR